MLDWLSPGSKIIITTRYEGLLKTHECCKVHRVEFLDHDESLELFSWHAFGQNNPSDDYLVESNKAVAYCRGLPLAIKTLGSSLSGKSIDVWKSQLEKMKEIPDKEILEKLKLSYDSLQDDHDKDLFLEIACFFVGKDKDSTITILNGCDYHTLVGIENLIDRNLLTIDMHDKLVMHQLIQEMGRVIVQQESPKVLGERSRLWNSKDSFHVLKEKNGTQKITGLVLDMHFLKEDKSVGNSLGHHKESSSKKRKRCHFEIFSGLLEGTANINSNEVVLEVDAFAGMSNLQLLQISDVQLCGKYTNFPKGLRWLYWSHCPLQSTPNDFAFDKLVALQMPHSSLKNVFNGAKCPVVLKILDLSHSHNLFATPDFSMLPNLERLVLENCTGLVKINESIARCSLYALSYGGWVGYRAAEMFPEMVEKVVIVSSGVGGCTEEQRREGLRKIGVKKFTEMLCPEKPADLRSLAAVTMYKFSVAKWLPDFFIREFITMMHTKHSKERLELVEHLLERKAEYDLPVLTQETLLVWGDQDRVFPLFFAYQLHRHLGAKSKLEIIRDTGHAVNMEAPALLNDLIKWFVLGDAKLDF